jgi:hypothetical protein
MEVWPTLRVQLVLLVTLHCTTACRKPANDHNVVRGSGSGTAPSAAAPTLAAPTRLEPSAAPTRLGANEPLSIGDFYSRFRSAALRDDREFVAKQFQFPITVASPADGGAALTIRDAPQFVEHYDELMTRPLLEVIRKHDRVEPAVGPATVGSLGHPHIKIFHVCDENPSELCRAGPIRIVAIRP